MKKTTLNLWLVSILTLMLATSCERWDPFEWDDDPKTTTTGGSTTGGGTTGWIDTTMNCGLTGTLVEMCEPSDLGKLWILGDDGQYYKPCDASILHTMDLAFPMEAGTRVMFGYSEINGPSICDIPSGVICPTVYYGEKKIKLTCIQPFWNDTPVVTGCKPVRIIKDYSVPPSEVEVLEASRNGNCISVRIKYSADAPVNESEIDLVTMDKSLIGELPPGNFALFFANVSSGTSSKYLYETSLSFDVSALSAGHAYPSFYLQGWNGGL